MTICNDMTLATIEKDTGWNAALQLGRVGVIGAFVSEIVPLLIIGQLEQYNEAGATAIATVMLVASFALLLVINALQAWAARRGGKEQ